MWCLVEQIKLSPRACTHFSMAHCVCVCSVCVYWYICVCVYHVVCGTQHKILIPGPNPVILRLSHSVKCSSQSHLIPLHSLVASNVSPDTHKQHLSKWHPIHYTPHHTQRRGDKPTHTRRDAFMVHCQILSFISSTIYMFF